MVGQENGVMAPLQQNISIVALSLITAAFWYFLAADLNLSAAELYWAAAYLQLWVTADLHLAFAAL